MEGDNAEVPIVDSSRKPHRKPQVIVRQQPEDDGMYVVYDGENETVLLLNSSGKVVWDLCDGQRSVNEILAAIAAKFMIPEGTASEAELCKFLLILMKANLVELRERSERL